MFFPINRVLPCCMFGFVKSYGAQPQSQFPTKSFFALFLWHISKCAWEWAYCGLASVAWCPIQKSKDHRATSGSALLRLTSNRSIRTRTRVWCARTFQKIEYAHHKFISVRNFRSTVKGYYMLLELLLGLLTFSKICGNCSQSHDLTITKQW